MNSLVTIKSLQNVNAIFSLAHPEIQLQKFKPKLNSSTIDAFFFDTQSLNEANILDTFSTCISLVHNDSVFIFDNIHSSKKSSANWKSICSDTRVSVSIDIFKFGLVFLRYQQPKQHFKIRV